MYFRPTVYCYYLQHKRMECVASANEKRRHLAACGLIRTFQDRVFTITPLIGVYVEEISVVDFIHSLNNNHVRTW